MEIKLDPDAVAEIASAAIMNSLSEETRQTVIKQAIAGLLEPDKGNRYSTGYGKTPLQQAFDSAIHQAAFQAVRDYIAEDEQTQAMIKDMLGPLINGALTAEANDYRSGLAEAIGTAIGNWLNEQARKQD